MTRKILVAAAIFSLIWIAAAVVSAAIAAITQLFVPFGYMLLVLVVIGLSALFAWIIAAEFA